MSKQHNNSRMIFSVVALFILAASLHSCYNDPFTQGDLQIDIENKTLAFEAIFNEAPSTQGTWHFIVHKDGTYGSSDKCIFSTGVSPHQIYTALKKLGAEDGNNVTPDNIGAEDLFTEGSVIEISITWDDAPKTYLLTEFLEERVPPEAELQEYVGIEIRFGGNRTNEDVTDPPSDTTGCLCCLYSCKAGVTSNAKANLYLLEHDSPEGNIYRYYDSPDVVPPDGTTATIIIKVR